MDDTVARVTAAPARFKVVDLWGRLTARIRIRRRQQILRRAETFFTWPDASVGPSELAGHPPSDIIHLHWINRFLDFVTCVPHLAQRAPIVWTLHDANLVHGGWHYDPTAVEVQSAAGACDLELARIKSEVLSRLEPSRCIFASPSRWLAQRARRHPVLGQFPIEVVPYGVETDTFSPGNKAAAKQALGLAEASFVVGFVAHSLADPRKGFGTLRAAVARLSGERPMTILCAGEGLLQDEHVVSLGRIESDRLLALLYNAADVFVCPSLQDNLPNTVLEAQACGTPVIASDVGGLPDAVVDGEVGFLVPPGDVTAIERALRKLFDAASLRQQIGAAARRRAVAEFADVVQAERYVGLYQRLCH